LLVPQVGAAITADEQPESHPVSQPVLQPRFKKLKLGLGNACQLILKRKSISFGRLQGSQPVSHAAIAMSLPQPGPATGASQHEVSQPQPPMPNMRSNKSPPKLWLQTAKEAARAIKVDLIFIETRLHFPKALQVSIDLWG
jgi:hypothetical protein